MTIVTETVAIQEQLDAWLKTTFPATDAVVLVSALSYQIAKLIIEARPDMEPDEREAMLIEVYEVFRQQVRSGFSK